MISQETILDEALVRIGQYELDVFKELMELQRQLEEIESPKDT